MSFLIVKANKASHNAFDNSMAAPNIIYINKYWPPRSDSDHSLYTLNHLFFGGFPLKNASKKAALSGSESVILVPSITIS